MRRTKILFLITKATWGGAQRYVYDLATHLPKDAFDVVVAYGTSGKLADDLTTQEISRCIIPELGRDVSPVADVMSFFQMLRCIRNVKPDVVHLNSSKAAAFGALAARLAGIKKIIFTIHGWPFKESRNVFARLLIYKISWLTALMSHTVIVMSKDDERLGKRMWWVGKKIIYIPLGVEPHDVLSREAASSELKITTANKRVVTIAELTKNKGISYAIAAIAQLKHRGTHIDYFIISDGEERERLTALARELNVADRVHFLGFVPHAASYLKAFDVFLLPSIKEGMPYVLLEAANANLPIIATDAVDFDHGVKVPAGNSAAIASALQQVQTAATYNVPSLEAMVEATTRLYH